MHFDKLITILKKILIIMNCGIITLDNYIREYQQQHATGNIMSKLF